MKKIIIKIIKRYQTIPGLFHLQCRHVPTCSNYAIEAIETYGVTYGTLLSIKRVLRCNPWSKAGYDPVPKRQKKEGKFL